MLCASSLVYADSRGRSALSCARNAPVWWNQVLDVSFEASLRFDGEYVNSVLFTDAASIVVLPPRRRHGPISSVAIIVVGVCVDARTSPFVFAEAILT